MKSRILSDSPTNFLPTYFDISSKSFSAFCFLPLSPFINFSCRKKTNIHSYMMVLHIRLSKIARVLIHQICVATPSNFLKIFLFSVWYHFWQVWYWNPFKLRMRRPITPTKFDANFWKVILNFGQNCNSLKGRILTILLLWCCQCHLYHHHSSITTIEFFPLFWKVSLAFEVKTLASSSDFQDWTVGRSSSRW